MDNESLAAVWQKIYDQARKYDDIDASQIDAFFSRLKVQAFSEGYILLTTSNRFLQSWIKTNYLKNIEQALLDLYNVPFEVIIEVDESMESESSLSNITNTEEETQKEPISTISDKKAKEEPLEDLDPDLIQENIGFEKLTFENFVMGSSNRMAYSMALSVAENPGKAHLNPLFIYGKSGLGKTHLLMAIKNYIKKTYPSLKTKYVDAMEMVNDYSDAATRSDLDKKSYKNFKRPYLEADILLIDDVQQIEGKTSTIDMLFQLMNTLFSQGKQVVLAADRSPKSIKVEERYQSRFNQGGTCDIQPPEVETKLGIIRRYIADYKEEDPTVDIPDDVQVYLAEISGSNIRELKSAIMKLIFMITTGGKTTITVDDAVSLLSDHFTSGSMKRLDVEDIQRTVEEFYQVSHADITGKKRQANIVYARKVCMYLCREMLDISQQAVGEKFGGKDHATVKYSVDWVENALKEDRQLNEELEILRRQVRE